MPSAHMDRQQMLLLPLGAEGSEDDDGQSGTCDGLGSPLWEVTYMIASVQMLLFLCYLAYPLSFHTHTHMLQL